MELREIYDFGKGMLILEKSKLPTYALAKLRYSFAKSDAVNANNRIYPEKILAREIGKKNEELKKQKIAGMLEHPLDGFTKLDKTMHALSDISYDPGTKLGWAESFILDTSGGRDFMTLMKSGLRLGASMRGVGNVGQDRKVQDDYGLMSIDFVANPSFGQDAVIDATNLIESANGLFQELGKEDKMNTKSKEKLMELNYNRDMDQGRFSGSLEDWKAKNAIFVECAVLQVEECIGVEEALKRLNRPDLIQKLANEQRRVEPRDVLYESFVAGVSATEFAKKINENIAQKEETDALGFTESQLSLYISEAIAAGADMSTAEKRKKYLARCLKINEEKKREEAKHLEEKQRTEKEILKERLLEDKKKKETLLANVKRLLEKSGDDPEVVKTLRKILEEV